MSDCCTDKPETPKRDQVKSCRNSGKSDDHNVAEKVQSHEMASCCTPLPSTPVDASHEHAHQSSCCDTDHTHAGGMDYLLWVSFSICTVFYGFHLVAPGSLPDFMQHFAHSIFEMLNSMWWGVLLGLVFVGLLANVPQNLVLSVLGKGGSLNGILRATAAGVLLDLCSHGILMVGTKLYQKGASLGQVMAFLIASPWNSFSLTLIMFSLIGFKWTMLFIIVSMVIAVISGWIFDRCVDNKILPANPNAFELNNNFQFWPEARRQWSGIVWSFDLVKNIVREGASGSRMVLRWLLFGVVLAALIRTFVSVEFFQQWFGPSLIGILLTLIAATVIEVCSEGSTPIAADLMNRAAAPGNAFTFMMAGVSTDYTEVMVLKDVTKSWKIALFLPLITLPQILVVGYAMNNF
ncbi:MAG: ATPase [Gammaproteobacteria bacterium]|nr:MAG: ATPase [Gammaproteobacteria bacterium]